MRKSLSLLPWIKFMLVCFLSVFLPTGLLADESLAGSAPEFPVITNIDAEHAEASHSGAHDEAHSEHHEMPLYAVELFNIGPFVVTNSMVATWVAALILILFARYAMRNAQEVPNGAQNFWEWIVEGLYDFLEGVIGPDLVKKTFWFFASIFVFILLANWLGLVPGIGTIGWDVAYDNGTTDFKPLFRGANADLNMTLAMAMVFFLFWIVWAIQSSGVKGSFLHIFGPKGDATGFMKIMMIVVFAFVGVLELVSIMFRPVSLSFRLFGNTFAGENMLETMAAMGVGMGSVFAALIPIPFYFMEIMVGLVQALVFMLLTAVFTLLICHHDEEHH
jgi:F-type H+-transporting ATPase subunit a